MKSVIVNNDADVTVSDVDDLLCPDDRFLLRVEASGVNRIDLLQRQGSYVVPAGESTTLGVEVSGTIIAMGDAAKAADHHGLAVGDHVCALVGGGGYASLCAVEPAHIMRYPDVLSPVEAAAIPEAWLTAYAALFWSGKLSHADSVLIHAGASGVSTAAIQLARHHLETGSKIFVTASNEEKLEKCKSLGATHVINYKEEDFAERVLSETGGAGVNVVIDFIGGPYFESNLKVASRDGRIILLGFLGGPTVEGVGGSAMSLAPILRKRLSIIGSTLRSRSNEYKAKLSSEFSNYAFKLFADGSLKAVVSHTYLAEKVREAHELMINNKNMGKIILTWPVAAKS